MKKTEHSQWRNVVESGLDGLITEMNRVYRLNTEEQEKQRVLMDLEFRDELLDMLKNLVESRKLSEMYDKSRLGDIGYSGKVHLDASSISHELSHCTCEEHC